MPQAPPDGVAPPVPPVAARAEGRIGGRRLKLTAEQWAQAGRLIAAGESRKRVAIIYDIGVSTLYNKFPAH